MEIASRPSMTGNFLYPAHHGLYSTMQLAMGATTSFGQPHRTGRSGRLPRWQYDRQHMAAACAAHL